MNLSKGIFFRKLNSIFCHSFSLNDVFDCFKDLNGFLDIFSIFVLNQIHIIGVFGLHSECFISLILRVLQKFGKLFIRIGLDSFFIANCILALPERRDGGFDQGHEFAVEAV